ncbi:T-cell immunomodulatory protein-like protein [Diplonema papillatum]|nr:T-cell immunomodulatory protein-like protein [Diplonema papillatum]
MLNTSKRGMAHEPVRSVFLFLVVVNAAFADFRPSSVLPDIDGTIAALGDYDSDLRIDLFFVHGNSVDVISGDTFADVAAMTLPCKSCSIVNVVPTDLNEDGFLDTIVQYIEDGSNTLRNVAYLQPEDSQPVQLPDTVNQILATNIFGLMRIDLIATMALSGGGTSTAIMRNMGCPDPDTGCVMQFRCYLKQAQDTPPAGCTETALLQDVGLDTAEDLSALSDSATVDLDGDCSADTVLSLQNSGQPNTRTLMFLRSVAESTPFKAFSGASVSSAVVCDEVGFITWYDVDSDGDMDMIAPFCGSGSCTASNGLRQFDSVITVLNQQSDPGCDGYHCCNAQPFGFADLSDAAALAKADGVKVTPIDGTMVEQKYAKAAFGTGVVFPPLIRLCDYDNDRSPDIVLVAINDDGGSEAQVYRGTSESGEKGTFRRESEEALSDVDNMRVAFWYDIDEDGTSDIIANFVDPSTGAGGLHALVNDLDEANHLFFKALGLNGRCHRHCKTKPRNPKPRPYGVNMPGVTHKLFFKIPRTMRSENIYMTGVQLSQSQYLSLQSPYSSWGLGDTNSYIETYFCGYHVATLGDAYRSWLALLPNSQVIVINDPYTKPDDWEIELFVSPSKYVLGILIVTVTSLAALAIPIVILRYRELKEDAIERKRDRPMMPL